MKKYLGLAGLIAGALLVGQFAPATAHATPTVCPTGTMGAPVCIASASPLQSEFNSITVSGPHINIYTGQTTPSAYWAIGATGGSENTVVFDIADALAPGASFGIYDPTNKDNQLTLFSEPSSGTGGTMQSGFSATLSQVGTNGFMIGNFEPGDKPTVTFGDGGVFGYFLTDSNGTFYSDPMLNANSPAYPNGAPQMAAYEGNGSTHVAIPGLDDPTGKVFESNEFMLAWDGSPYASSNMDFNDFVVMVESVHPVPEPAVLGLFGIGLAVLGGLVAFDRRRRTRRAD